jgi:hypothetical protein
MDVSEAKRLKALAEEHAKLKKRLAEQIIDTAAVRESPVCPACDVPNSVFERR